MYPEGLDSSGIRLGPAAGLKTLRGSPNTSNTSWGLTVSSVSWYHGCEARASCAGVPHSLVMGMLSRGTWMAKTDLEVISARRTIQDNGFQFREEDDEGYARWELNGFTKAGYFGMTIYGFAPEHHDRSSWQTDIILSPAQALFLANRIISLYGNGS